MRLMVWLCELLADAICKALETVGVQDRMAQNFNTSLDLSYILAEFQHGLIWNQTYPYMCGGKNPTVLFLEYCRNLLHTSRFC